MSNELSIGNKIIILRKDKNWSQVELAKQINASREIISRYERNESQPSLLQIPVILTTQFQFKVTT